MRKVTEGPPVRWRLVAFWGALSLFLSVLEYLVPKPVPFFRLGLSNLPFLIVLELFSLRELAWLVVLKVLGQGLVNGTLMSYVFLFSLAGSAASAVVMTAVQRWDRGRYFSAFGLSLLGALASNGAQIGLSIQFLFGPGAWVLAPVLAALGTVTGGVIGFLADLWKSRSRWWETHRREFSR